MVKTMFHDVDAIHSLQGMPKSNNLMDNTFFEVLTISGTWIILQTAY
jgi:hypothetical protein